MGNPVVHFDISGPDPEELQKFYGRLFGWQVTAIPGMSYALVDTQAGSGVNGGIGLARPITASLAEWPGSVRSAGFGRRRHGFDCRASAELEAVSSSAR